MSDPFTRFNSGDDVRQPVSNGDMLTLWLDDLMRERETVIMRLRQIDETLVKYGRLKEETIGRRVR